MLEGFGARVSDAATDLHGAVGGVETRRFQRGLELRALHHPRHTASSNAFGRVDCCI
ncbi:hypothetical protein [Sphingopyxis sp. JAI128]|uniref:hypothetical protein n=1 Tax=Sphingopyxis sp. JAI128 TaxID=2723066 RepID=UPI00160A0FE5|nr:hypothetical protein [Sphingopyxis sp. JAI128]MBB6427955.1 hypothetical protein [Sphingopyxis sp. JAI128]